VTTRMLFREVNERIEGLARGTRSGLEIRPEQFLCECQDDQCTVRLDLTLEEYAAISRDGGVFIVAPGHAAHSDRVIAVRGSYVLVEEQLSQTPASR
jgi:hypothetical protein